MVVGWSKINHEGSYSGNYIGPVTVDKVDNAGTWRSFQVYVKKGENDIASTIAEVSHALKVQFPHSVKCDINVEERRARISRIELYNIGNKEIPAGWRSQIHILSGIDRRYALIDTIVLPTILPGIVVPLGPYAAEVPYDIMNSQDEWNLEIYVTDPYGNRECLFRSLTVSFG